MSSNYEMVSPEGNDPPTFWLKASCSANWAMDPNALPSIATKLKRHFAIPPRHIYIYRRDSNPLLESEGTLRVVTLAFAKHLLIVIFP